MQMRLVGYRNYSFVSDDGKSVEGCSFYVVRQSSSDSVVGMEALKINVPRNIRDECGKPEVNAVYDVSYNERGRIVSYKMIQPAPMGPAPGVRK